MWVPAAVVSDVVRASPSATDPQGERLRAVVPFWWVAWLGAWVALSTALVGIPLIGVPNVGVAHLCFTLFSGLSALLFLAAAAAFTRIVLQVAARQDRHVLAPSVPDPPPPQQTRASPLRRLSRAADSAEPVPPPSPIPPAALSGARTWLLLAVTGYRPVHSRSDRGVADHR
ncbi:hypothetical protein GCM10023320_11590 [Pseudonocardia adelaidensis]|uniref:DUF4328 domain-containing protein n=1 Tax=Pseudonocardia adelaidensis TaxID=648754 RepID=A0ABP9NIZ0_9PSEU